LVEDPQLKTYTNPVFAYRRPPELDGSTRHCGVVIVGAGPVGLAAAIDFAQREIPVLVLDDDDTVSVGSRAICYAKRTLEILDRLGCGEPVVQKGVGWNVGKVFHGDHLTYQFDLLPEPGHHRPAFVNLQQYYFEEYLVRRVDALAAAEVRWKHRVVDVARDDAQARLRVATPDGEYALTCDWLIVCDGARSPVRHMLGLDTEGLVFHDRFLIADIRMATEFPTERWFWFDPPFHPNQSVLLHRQADNVWRVDFQLGWDADPEEEKKPEKILPRLRAMLGADVDFEIEWASVYTFQCRRMQKFRHGRVLFAGDAAHLVSPFGARGANSGVQDTDNLVWKLEMVLRGQAPESLLDTYDAERVAAADENILNSTRATDFITPKGVVSRTFRDAVLALAHRHTFARKLVNSGRLSVPKILADSSLNTPDSEVDSEAFSGVMVPGAPAADAPVTGPRGDWLLPYFGGGFALLMFGDGISAEAARELAQFCAVDRAHARAPATIPCRIVQVGGAPRDDRIVIQDKDGMIAARYDARPQTCYLIRPDQHVCARWRAFDPAGVRRAIARATCNDERNMQWAH
jgi:3-(3-hydroxy-phenyl)propionate hydroxylase